MVQITLEQNKRNTKALRQHKIKIERNIRQQSRKPLKISQYIDVNKLTQTLRDIKYDEYEDIYIWKSRLKRAIYYCKQGKFKKANQALEPTHICNLNINGNKAKLLSKLPIQDVQTIQQPPFNKQICKYKLKLLKE